MVCFTISMYKNLFVIITPKRKKVIYNIVSKTEKRDYLIKTRTNLIHQEYEKQINLKRKFFPERVSLELVLELVVP